MNESFSEFLSKNQIDTATIEQSARYYITQASNYLSPEEMREKLIEATGSADQVDKLIQTLKDDSLALENAALAVLSSAWDDSTQGEQIQQIIKQAKSKLSTIDPLTLAAIAIFGLCVIITGGRKKEQITTRRNPDGSFETIELVEYYSPAEPVRAIMHLIGMQLPHNSDEASLPSDNTDPQLPEGKDSSQEN